MINELCQKLYQYAVAVVGMILFLSVCILVYKCCKLAKKKFLDSLSPQERHELEERRRQRAEPSKDTDWLSLWLIWSIWF